MNLCKTCGTICPFDDEHEECDAYAPMTEENWLRSCTTEQLAEFLACVEARQNADYNEETKAWVEWLKQPHTK